MNGKNDIVYSRVNLDELVAQRRPETRDIVERLGYITRDNVLLENMPSHRAAAVFNPAIAVNGDTLILYARVVLGYYKYISAIVSFETRLDKILSSGIEDEVYTAKPVILPSTIYDISGAEDPRIYEIGGKLLMTYTGRTRSYFSPEPSMERCLPVTAVKDREGWKRIHVYRFPPTFRRYIECDKDAYLVYSGGDYYFFHRPSTIDGSFYLAISKVDNIDLEAEEELREVIAGDTFELPLRAGFERKIGWATPPLKINRNKYIAFIHGVDNVIEAYRLFAVEIELGKSISVNAVTPTYIMEPKTIYEIYGDRPYTIFPCGLWSYRDKILLSWGAGDYTIGIGLINVDTLLEILDRGRIN